MAKQTVGPIAQHVEKAILGVAALVFLYVAAMYLVVSPNEVGTEGQEVGPAEVDKQVQEAAERLRDKLLQAEPPEETFEDPLPALRRAADSLGFAGVSSEIFRPVPFGLPTPDIGVSSELGSRALVKVLSLDPPGLLQGRSGLYLTPPAAFGSTAEDRTDVAFLQDVNWVTVAALFDRQRQEEICREAGYDPQGVETVFLGMDVERRVLSADGSYSDWEPVNTIAPHDDPELPTPTVDESERGPNVSPEDRQQISKFFELIGSDNGQLALMRPLFPHVEYGSFWRYPRLGEFDVRAMDAEYQSSPECRYPECADLAPRIDPSKDWSDLMKEAEAALDAGELDFALILAETAVTKADRDADKREAAELVDRIKVAKDQAEADRAARGRLIQMLWAHDAGIGSVLSGRTYQYHARARLYNRYCGMPTQLANPKDAEIVQLIGPWSEPSDPITIPPDTILFVTGEKASKQQLKVEVFKWVAGAWVMKPFNVAVGDHIGEVKEVDSPRADDDAVNFYSGATVVDIDFRKSIRRPGRSGRLTNVDTAALVFVDATDQLHEQWLEIDKNSDEYKEMKASVYKSTSSH